MSSAAAKYIAKRVLNETAKNAFGKEDPNFDRNPASRPERTRTRTKSGRVKKDSRPGLTAISKRDAKILKKARRRAHIVDNGLFNFCGFKVGYGAVIGLIPFIGDFVDFFMALMVISTCSKIDGGLPAEIKQKMMLRAIFDCGIGFVPFLGDLADAYYKCNIRNVNTLEHLLEARGDVIIAQQREAQRVAALNQALENPVDPPPNYESDSPVAAGRSHATRPRGRQDMPAEPKKAKTSRGWFGFGNKRARQDDIESGNAGPTQQPTLRTDNARPV